MKRKPRRNKHGLRSRWELGHYRLGELAAFAVVVAGAAAVLALAAAAAFDGDAVLALPRWVRVLDGGAASAMLAGLLYGSLIEARRLTVTRVALSSPKIKGRPLRLAHLSDIHVRWWSPLEDELLSALRELEPDLILMSGDYTAVPGSIADARRLLKELAGIAPVLGSRGNGEYRRPHAEELFAGTGAKLLMNERYGAKVASSPVVVDGVDPGEEEALAELGGRLNGDYSVCLYHYPDFVPELERLPYDLMLCGHTHGGQVRLPLVGALISLCRAGPRFAAGHFRAGGRSAYVSRGIGTESHGLFPLRFLCPPELVLITVSKA